ncbi:MFS transporter [Pseudonocardia sp. UM4_GMWB1]|uniref:MFS transporter n=1 Tax=Pseudonocardia sp. UM4_GMWB1 TaxID=2212989 RepID=UPI00307DDA36
MELYENGSAEAAPAPVTASTRRRAIVAASIGNAVEWYDYTVYGYLAATLGVIFFPSTDPTASILASFAAFALAFIVRPIGGIVFGSIGDRIGRQKTLAAVVILISVATFVTGLLPGYASIGVAAPVLLVLLRIIQGLSAGGEVGGAVVFLAEYAPAHRRGFQVGWVNMSALPGAFAGAVFVTVLSATLSQEEMVTWGWRVPFLLALPLGLIGLYLRLKVEDTPEFRALVAAGEHTGSPLRETVKGNVRGITLCLALTTMHAAGFYMVLTYIPTYLATVHNFERGSALVMMMIALGIAIAVIPITASLSDRIGRRPVVAAACIGYILLAYPIFVLMSSGDTGSVILSQVLLGLLFGTFSGAPFAAMIELFATRVRYTAFSIGYNISIALFGGTTPMISVWLVAITGIDVAPALILIAAGVVSLVAVSLIPETARLPLGSLGSVGRST